MGISSNPSQSVEQSIAKRIAKLNEALGDPWSEDKQFLPYAEAFKATDKSYQSRKPFKPSENFLRQIDNFLHAAEIAYSLVEAEGRGDLDYRALLKFAIESIRCGHIRSLRGLKELEVTLLTEWYEGIGSTVDLFWKKIQEANLPYQKRNLLEEIWQAEKVPSRKHYDFLIDNIVILQDNGAISTKQVLELNRMIRKFEKRR